MKQYILSCYITLFLLSFPVRTYADDNSQADYFHEFVPNMLTYEMRSGWPISSTLVTSFEDLASKLPTSHGSDWVPEALGQLGDKRAIPIVEEKLKQETEITARIRISVGLIILGKVNHYDKVLSGLKAKIPEYPNWVKTNSVPFNPISVAAEAAIKISSYNIKLPPDVINELIRLISHPDGGVGNHVLIALDQTTKNTFFMWSKGEHVFVPGYTLPQMSNGEKDMAKRMLQEAWTEWWSLNKDNYINGKAYVVNGLKMEASWKTQEKMDITLTNMGKRSIRLLVEKEGPHDNKNERLPAWVPTLSLFIGKKRLSQKQPGNMEAACATPQQQSSKSGADKIRRLAHVEWLELKPGDRYKYSFDFMEMFHDAATQLKKNQTERIAISYRRDYPVKEETWVGEVCSDFIGLNTDNN